MFLLEIPISLAVPYYSPPMVLRSSNNKEIKLSSTLSYNTITIASWKVGASPFLVYHKHSMN